MLVSAPLIQRIRVLINEPSDENFSDKNLSVILNSAESENHALYLLWTQKASFVKISDVKSIRAGGETIEKYTTADYIDVCLKIADAYKKAWEAERSNLSSSMMMYKNTSEDRLW